MLYRLRKLALFDASTTEYIDRISKYYGINRIFGLIFLLQYRLCYLSPRSRFFVLRNDSSLHLLRLRFSSRYFTYQI